MNLKSKIGTAVAASVMAFATFGLNTSAHAIQCHGNFQVQKDGSHIATPYCQDNFLGSIARKAGIRVSNKDIRRNPNTKSKVCKIVGHDNRVSSTCAPYTDAGRNG